MDEGKNEIQIKYRWTVDELRRAYRWASRCRFLGLLRWLSPLVLLFFFGMGIIQIWQSASFWEGVPPMCVGVFIAILQWGIHPWLLRRQFAKRPDRNIEIKWHISGERICIQHEFGSSEFVWAALAKVVETPDGFLFYPNNQVFHWLPKHGFASDAEYGRLSELSRERAARFVQVA